LSGTQIETRRYFGSKGREWTAIEPNYSSRIAIVCISRKCIDWIGYFTKYYPSVSGSSVFLIDGNKSLTDLYKNTLNEKLENYGENSEKTVDRLASFYKVTNTYLSVFGVFGVLGMITGLPGWDLFFSGIITQRKQEFALMLATGFNIKR